MNNFRKAIDIKLPFMNIKHLIDESANSLAQLASVLKSVSQREYAEFMDSIFNASIGLHVRHVIDHYDMFFLGLQDQLINYDVRPREREIELDRDYALERIDRLLDQLNSMPVQDQPLQVIMDMQSDTATLTRQSSSVARELAFLHSHSTHHYATLVFMLKSMEKHIALDDFGLAPATIRNQEALKCAP